MAVIVVFAYLAVTEHDDSHPTVDTHNKRSCTIATAITAIKYPRHPESPRASPLTPAIGLPWAPGISRRVEDGSTGCSTPYPA